MSQTLIRNFLTCISDMAEDQFRLFCFLKRDSIRYRVKGRKLSKDPSKPVQHFIQHHVFAMLDEMLEWFAQLQNL